MGLRVHHTYVFPFPGSQPKYVYDHTAPTELPHPKSSPQGPEAQGRGPLPAKPGARILGLSSTFLSPRGHQSTFTPESLTQLLVHPRALITRTTAMIWTPSGIDTLLSYVTHLCTLPRISGQKSPPGTEFPLHLLPPTLGSSPPGSWHNSQPPPSPQ